MTIDHLMHQIRTMTDHQADKLEDPIDPDLDLDIDELERAAAERTAARHQAITVIEAAEATTPTPITLRQEAQGACPRQGLLVLLAVDTAVRATTHRAALTDTHWDTLMGRWEHTMGKLPTA